MLPEQKKTPNDGAPGEGGWCEGMPVPWLLPPTPAVGFLLGKKQRRRVLGVREESNIKTGPQCSGDAATEPVRFLVHLCFGASEVMTSLWLAPGR